MAASNLTAREQDVLHAVAQVGTFTVDDWEKVATLANMKTAKYARDTWAGVRKKLTAGDTTKGAKAANGDAGDGENGVATPSGKAKKKSTPKSTPRKRKNDDADDEESPTKKTPKTKNKKSEKKAKDSDDEDAEVKPEPNEAGELMDDMAI